MKILLLLCIIAHFAAASPPFFGSGGLLSGGLLGSLGGLFGAGSDTETDIDEDGAPVDISPESAASSSGAGSLVGRQFLGDVLGVKIGLLSSLRNVVSPQEIGFENGASVDSGSEVVDGTGAGIPGHNGGGQMFAPGSGFSQFGSGVSETQGASSQGFGQGFGGSESSGAASQAAYAGQGQGNGYNYNSGSASSGYAGNGGYTYNRPQPVAQPIAQPVVANALSGNSFAPQQRFDDGGFRGGSFETQQFNGGNLGSEFSSGSAALESNGGSATRSGTAGLGGSSSGIGSLVSAGVQVPIQLLTAYRNGINRGFDSVTSGVSLLQRILGGLGGGDSNSIDQIRK